MSQYAKQYLEEAQRIAASLDPAAIEKMVRVIETIREQNGRLFFVGVGGGAGNANHAVNDFRKIAGLECYTPPTT